MSFETFFEEYNWPTLGYIKLPKYEPSIEDKNEYKMTEEDVSLENLRKAVRIGYANKLKSGVISKDKVYIDRIKTELETLGKLGFEDYILMVNSITDYARRNKIATGLGRGSGAGSVVLFCLGVTGVDPIRHGLLFERFISATRAKTKDINGINYIDSSSLPDIDLDFPMTRKDDIRKFIEDRFPGKTASIANLNKLSAKILIKETLKVVEEASEEQANEASNTIEKRFGKVDSIASSMKDNKSFKAWAKDHMQTVEIAQRLEGLIKNKSVHASGIIVTENEITDSIPLEPTADGRPCSIYSMGDAQKIGIKIDNLGLKTLDLIQDCFNMTGKSFSDINIDDPSIYNYLQYRDEYFGLFQIEAGIGEQTVKKVRPRDIAELSDCIAIGRPGAFKHLQHYVDVKENKADAGIDKRLEHILGPTKGIIVFQEQLMKIAVQMAGMSEIESDQLRKVVGKKLRDEMPKWEEKFKTGAKAKGFDDEAITKTWQVFIDSADYSFNKSHSVAYASLTALCTYLKANHPLEFYTALLRVSDTEADQQRIVAKIYSEMRKVGLTLLPPHVLKSDLGFKIETDHEGNKGIRFGLRAIKGLSDKSLEKIQTLKSPSTNPFEFFSAAKDAGLTIGNVSALIQAGTCDFGGDKSRSRVVLEAQLWNILSPKEKNIFHGLGEKYDYDVLNCIIHVRDEANKRQAEGYKFKRDDIKPSRIDTIRKKAEPYMKIYNMNKKHEDFANWFYQKNLLGFCYDKNLRDIFSKNFMNLQNVEEVKELEHKEQVLFVACVLDAKNGVSKNEGQNGKKTNYLKLMLSDESGELTALMFNEKIQRNDEYNKKTIKEGDIVFCKGVRWNDAVFLDSAYIQSNEVYTKLSDLKNTIK